MPDLEKTLIKQFLESYRKLPQGSYINSLESIAMLQQYVARPYGMAFDSVTQQWDPIERSLLLEALRDRIAAYWQWQTNQESEPSALLVTLIDYVEKESPYWFSYHQEQWLE